MLEHITRQGYHRRELLVKCMSCIIYLYLLAGQGLGDMACLRQLSKQTD